MQKDLHEAQASILKVLLFFPGSTFSALNKTRLSNDHFTFHIKHLVKEEIIEKKGNKYFLTQGGKLYANKLDVDALKMERFGTPSIAVTVKKVIRGKTHFLMHHRLKEPLYGYWGFVNGKVRFGEFTKATAKRELLEETGLTGEPKILSVTHKMRGPSRDNIKLDHFFFLYVVENATGKLKNTKEGKNYWKTLDEIRELNTFPGFKLYIDVIANEKYSPYIEDFIEVENI
jgi:ADP-ribose pyrophosphatase YjhB (NUDIX family)